MKKTFLIMLFCSGSMMLFAQQSRRHAVPQAVQRSYAKDYPNYKTESWDQSNNQWHTRYADRDHSNRMVDVYYDRYGRRMYSQSNWDRNDLPAPVRERMKNRYHSENYDAYRVEKPGRGFFFQITLGGNKKVYLDERGREVRYH